MAMGTSGAASGRRRGRAGRRAPMADINVTPLVDVMLVLLAIFMVTAPLIAAGVPVELPESRANPLPAESQEVTVTMTADGLIYYGPTAIGAGELSARLEAAVAASAKPPQVTLRADRSLPYGKVVEVMGEMNRAGIRAISLVTDSSVSAP